MVSDLDAITLQCTKEFEDSFSIQKNGIEGNRYKNILSEATVLPAPNNKLILTN